MDNQLRGVPFWHDLARKLLFSSAEKLFEQGERIGSAAARHAVRGAERALRIVGAAAEGKLQALTEGGRRVGPIDDVTIRDRAETELFRDPSVPKGTINLSVERGILVLRGEVPDEEMRERLAREGASIDGVWSVRNLLHLPGQAPEPVSA